MATQRHTTPVDDEFVAACVDIDDLLDKLQAHRADHFGRDPERLTWADVGSIFELRRQLAAALAFIEGTADA